MQNKSHLGTLSLFIDAESIYQSPAPEKYYNKNNSKQRSPTTDINDDKTRIPESVFLENISRYKEQFNQLTNKRKKKLSLSLPQKNKELQQVKQQKYATPQSPSYLWLFNKRNVYNDEIDPSRLKRNHQLLRTLNQIQQKRSRNKGLIDDSSFLRLVNDFKDETDERQKERQQQIDLHEKYSRKYVLFPQKDIKMRKNNQQRSKDKFIIQRFPQYKWSKSRGYNFQTPQNQRKYEKDEKNSSYYIDRIKSEQKSRNYELSLEQIVSEIVENIK
ncbi:hypothetical protein pb186bvf_011032 [Paramecium bursaria]